MKDDLWLIQMRGERERRSQAAARSVRQVQSALTEVLSAIGEGTKTTMGTGGIEHMLGEIARYNAWCDALELAEISTESATSGETRPSANWKHRK